MLDPRDANIESPHATARRPPGQVASVSVAMRAGLVVALAAAMVAMAEDKAAAYKYPLDNVTR